MAGRTLLFIIRKKMVVLFIAALFLTTGLYHWAASALARKAYYPLQGKKIVLDPGHGGVDSGANDSSGFKEKTVNLEVALKLRELLVLGGAEVIMTRTDDSDVTEKGDPGKKRYHRDMDGRRKLMNESGADVFISLHVNACRGAHRTRGAFVYYHKNSESGKMLAECLAAQLNHYVADYKKEGELAIHKACTANYYLLRNAKIPAALVEMGFMTHPEEKRLLSNQDYQKGLAKALADGLRDYFLNQALSS
ncbi:cell wall hydrolase/autolysin [Thermincola ferriacetica]|uniref:Cell wall hydrolase/autolysin n=1 Tax=Thermincola ferriacetica TaxID=281456 RepID=A0A0L6W5Y8_9FIRM|nr:N-acetylmuramoyl-L-alanine amidase [Thermincola ferriacetica]KNZ70514.1 cell wall hydrolase/autolysin [Thermincola ferriacetica]